MVQRGSKISVVADYTEYRLCGEIYIIMLHLSDCVFCSCREQKLDLSCSFSSEWSNAHQCFCLEQHQRRNGHSLSHCPAALVVSH